MDPLVTATPLNGVNIVLSRYLPEGMSWVRLPSGVFAGTTFVVNEEVYKQLFLEIEITRPEPSEYTVARILELLAPST